MCITSVHISLVRMQPYVPPHNGQGTVKSLKNEFVSKEKRIIDIGEKLYSLSQRFKKMFPTTKMYTLYLSD